MCPPLVFAVQDTGVSFISSLLCPYSRAVIVLAVAEDWEISPQKPCPLTNQLPPAQTWGRKAKLTNG